jgi:hypothetical protein
VTHPIEPQNPIMQGTNQNVFNYPPNSNKEPQVTTAPPSIQDRNDLPTAGTSNQRDRASLPIYKTPPISKSSNIGKNKNLINRPIPNSQKDNCFQKNIPCHITPGNNNTPPRHIPSTDEETYLENWNLSNQMKELILDHPGTTRKTIKEWTSNIGKFDGPSPSTYHPYPYPSPGFLSNSFNGEALPGVLRPAGSKMGITEASEAYNLAMGHPPATIFDLNIFLAQEYPAPPMLFEVQKHWINIPPYNMDFYTNIGMTFSLKGVSNQYSTFQSPKKKTPTASNLCQLRIIHQIQ